jgi:hypothetical protein
MEVVSISDLDDTVWQKSLENSDDAWFWHTRSYSNFLLEINSVRSVRDVSFAIVDKSKVVAVCPLYLDSLGGIPQLGCGNEPVPFPALARDISTDVRERILEQYFVELARFAEVYFAESICIRVSPLAGNHIANSFRPFNPLVRYGFLDLPFSTQVIDLRISESGLWSDIRKGHRYDIRRAEKVCEAIIWTHATITQDVFTCYQELHFKDAGRVTRSQQSFDMMFSWIKMGYAILVEAKRDGSSIAFILITIFSDGAFYGSACKDPDIADLNASHMLQWHTMLWLKSSGCKYYDLGMQYFGPQWSHVPTEKDINISKYKRGFGGVTIPVHSGEFFYKTSQLERVFVKRLERLSDGY